VPLLAVAGLDLGFGCTTDPASDYGGPQESRSSLITQSASERRILDFRSRFARLKLLLEIDSIISRIFSLYYVRPIPSGTTATGRLGRVSPTLFF
jgi:hypothetical protein